MVKEEEKVLNKPMKVFLLLVVALGLGILFMFVFGDREMEVVDTIIGENGEEIFIAEDGTRFIIDPSEILSGGPPKGGIGVDKGIPALAEENINFVSVEEADEWIEDDELVLALMYKGEERVYPLQIMTWHEIANDRVAGDVLLITYCPLCGSGIAYFGSVDVDGVFVESRFGTSGKLYNSNLVMYDEETDTYWQQIDGKAIVGELTGQELVEISIDTVTWAEWTDTHKDSLVLSRETGINRNYGGSAYANYFANDFLIFPVEGEDATLKLPNKAVVFGVEVDGRYKAYPEDILIEEGEIVDEDFGVRVSRGKDGVVFVSKLEDGSEVVKERDFWFAWFAFHPETELYGF